MNIFSKNLAYLMVSVLLSSSVFVSTRPILAALPESTTLTYNFDNNAQSWTARGCTISNSTHNPYSGKQSLYITDRTDTWQGAQIELSDTLEKNETYTFGVWVKYDEGAAEETITMVMQNDTTSKGTSYDWIVSNSGIKKGEWTYLEGRYTLPADFTYALLYVEASHSKDLSFYIDEVSIIGEQKKALKIQQNVPSLHTTYKDYFEFGAAISSHNLNNLEKELILKHFNSMTCENAMKPEAMLDYEATIAYMNQPKGDQVHPQVQLSADARITLDFAQENNIPMRGHVLAWHSQTPNWLFTENYSKASDAKVVSKKIMLERLENYTKAVFEILEEHYPDVTFYAFDVVNEAINPDREDGLRAPATIATTSGDDSNNENANNSMWMTTIGKDYIQKAFEYARKYAPKETKLAYNDYNECDSKKVDFMYELCKDLYDKGLLDIVGMQGHYNMTSPSITHFENALRKYASIGKSIEIQITELDITQENASDEGLLKQAYLYKNYFDVMKKLEDEHIANISSVTVWGIKDDESWRSDRFPLLFDKNYQTKPAFWGITDVAKLPVLAQEVKAYQALASASNLENTFLLQNDVSLVTADGTPLGTFKVLWDANQLYITVQPISTLNNQETTIKIFVGNSVYNFSLNKQKVISIPLDKTFVVGDTLFFDISLKVGDKIATWNNLLYDGISPIVEGTLGKLLITATPKTGIAPKATPILDGKLDSVWQKAPSFNVDTFSVGQKGATATAKTLWDEHYIYVLLEVKDSLLSKASADYYQQDSVEIFIDEDNGKTTSYTLGDVQYRVNFDNDRSINGISDANSFMTATSIVDGGYIVEAALPARMGSLKTGQVIGFDLQVNDDADGNGTRDNVSNWNDLTGNGWSSTENYGLLQLK